MNTLLTSLPRITWTGGFKRSYPQYRFRRLLLLPKSRNTSSEKIVYSLIFKAAVFAQAFLRCSPPDQHNPTINICQQFACREVGSNSCRYKIQALALVDTQCINLNKQRFFVTLVIKIQATNEYAIKNLVTRTWSYESAFVLIAFTSAKESIRRTHTLRRMPAITDWFLQLPFAIICSWLFSWKHHTDESSIEFLFPSNTIYYLIRTSDVLLPLCISVTPYGVLSILMAHNTDVLS